jgi:hypothetical protein
MRTHTLHANVTKTAIGYVRVSTQEQATEGVSLDAQRDRLRGYCKGNGIKLIDIVGDEGLSGSTLERPGLQAALHMLRRGRANTLIVVKLDRLSRSLRAVCALVEDYFADERYHLLSVCGMVNTHSAAGRMLMMNLANFNQFERDMIKAFGLLARQCRVRLVPFRRKRSLLFDRFLLGARQACREVGPLSSLVSERPLNREPCPRSRKRRIRSGVRHPAGMLIPASRE